MTESSPPSTPPPLSRSYDWIYDLLAGLLVVGFFYASVFFYWVPAHPGVDQNGYLVGGKNLAENLTMRLKPTKPGLSMFDPHQFVGRMWVGADPGMPTERFYPKYPIGLPALVAICLWVGGDEWGPILAYGISPLAMSLAVLATYLLVRQLASPFWALCGMVVFASSPVVMGLTNNPNSHATAVCFAAWGMYLLLRWWKRGGTWRAIGAGFLLGCTCTIRYSEGLLLIPLLIVIALNWRRWLEGLWALGAWTAPIGLLVWYNLASMGRITGYDGTNESSGFALQYALDNWDAAIRQLGSIALYCIFPFSVIGLGTMFWRNWRMGLVLAAWFVPGAVIYTFYYWSPDPVNQPPSFISYMRFFLTVLPALVVAAFWLFDQLGEHVPKPLAQAACGLVTLIAIAVQLQSSTFAAETDHANRLMLATNAQQVQDAAPNHAVIFAQDMNLLHHLQFVGDYLLYTGETFNKWFVDSLPQMDPNEPQGWDPGRRDALYNRLKSLNQQQLDDQARQLMTAALDSGRRVFFLISRRENDPPPRQRRANAPASVARLAFPGGDLVRRFAADRFDFDVVSHWSTPIMRPVVPQPNRPLRRRVEINLDRRNTLWQIVEITKKPPAPPAPPPTRPTRPATRPATTRRSS